jgi:hypothetical protein
MPTAFLLCDQDEMLCTAFYRTLDRLPTRCDEMRCLLLAPGWGDAMRCSYECYTDLYRLPTYLDKRLCDLDTLRCAACCLDPI